MKTIEESLLKYIPLRLCDFEDRIEADVWEHIESLVWDLVRVRVEESVFITVLENLQRRQ